MMGVSFIAAASQQRIINFSQLSAAASPDD
jgi:hypothetical protein